MLNHALVELPEAFPVAGYFAPVAQGFTEGEGVVPELEDRISYLFSGI